MEQTGTDFDWQLAEQILEELMTSSEQRRKKKMMMNLKKRSQFAGKVDLPKNM